MPRLGRVPITAPTLAILAAFVAAAPKAISGRDVARERGLSAGTLYPRLRQLEDAGWIDCVGQESGARGRPRYLYRLTPDAFPAAIEELKLVQILDLDPVLSGFDKSPLVTRPGSA